MPVADSPASDVVIRFTSGFVTETGAVRLGDLAERLAVSPAEFAQATGQTTESVSKNFGDEPVRLRHPEALRVAHELVEVEGLLKALGMSSERVRKWLRTPNPSFGGSTPMRLLIQHHGRDLINVLMAMAMGGSGT
jgi:hypothetical protein